MPLTPDRKTYAMIAERLDHKTMMETPEFWPCWPYLPLKRWKNNELETAVLFASAHGGAPVAFMQGANLYLVTADQARSAPTRTPADLVAEGWEVD